MCQVDTVYMTRVIMVLIAIWLVQRSENTVHLTGHKDFGTKQILREKWRSAGTGFEGSKFRDFSVPPGHMACMVLGLQGGGDFGEGYGNQLGPLDRSKAEPWWGMRGWGGKAPLKLMQLSNFRA